MNSGLLAIMLGVSLFLGGIALVAFLWSLKSGHFDDKEKFLNATKFDNEDDLNSAMEAEKKKKEILEKKKKHYMPED